MKTSTTIVHFHIGRGGRFHNSGHRSFSGEHDLNFIVNNSSRDLFLQPSEIGNVYQKVNKQYPNITELLDNCQDNEDYKKFEEITGLSLGEMSYCDCNGNALITEAEVDKGVGSIAFDGEYDSDECKYLHECDEEDLYLIHKSGPDSLIREYFDLCEDVTVDWNKFNGEYAELIEAYFNDDDFDITNYYNED